MSPKTLLQKILPPGSVQRYQDWCEFFDEKYPDERFAICDTEHHVNKGSTGGVYMPTLLTHGSFMLIDRQEKTWKIATDVELMLALGFHTFEHPKSSLASKAGHRRP